MIEVISMPLVRACFPDVLFLGSRMFTGIIDHQGEILAIRERSGAVSFDIKTQFPDCQLGESISVNGVCLTVTAFENGFFSVDLSSETLVCTTAGDWAVGQLVHLERALRVGDRLGGHWVTGHVDAGVQVAQRRQDGDCLFLAFTGVQSEHTRFLVKKGSVALDGVSLTVNDVAPDGFDVMLIPQTLEITHLNELRVGDSLNIEYDYLLKGAKA